VIIEYILIILSLFAFLERVSIANSLQYECCETESLIPTDAGFAAVNEERWRQ